MKQVPVLGASRADMFDTTLPAGQIDTTRYFRLLDQVGTERAELIARLIADLQMIDHGLRQALAGPDWAALRHHSHVLMSLAGTFGASALYRTTLTLNLSANNTDAASLDRTGDIVLAQLTTLIDFVAQTIDTP